MDNYRPTNSLRFVEREEESNLTADGHLLPHDVVRVITRRILQQRWTSDFCGEEDEWRDVPTAEETPNVVVQGREPVLSAKRPSGTEGSAS